MVKATAGADAGSAERRFNSKGGPVKVQTRAEGGKMIVGYAAVFYRESDPGTEYELWDDMVERIMPGAFDRALREKDDARGLFNHDWNWVLGRVGAGTVRLSVDEIGLRYEIDVPDTQAGRDVLVLVERGDIPGSSFAFLSERTIWAEEGELSIREVYACRVFDVGPVLYPAYEATTTGVRSENAKRIREEREHWKSERAAQGDESEEMEMRLRELDLDECSLTD